MDYVSSEQRQEICAMRNLTLNGNRAKVSGYRSDFATVTDTVTRLSAQWSWQAAHRIAHSHGRFES